MDTKDFKQSNTIFGPPEGMTEEQVRSCHGQIFDYEGQPAVRVAWYPTIEELYALNEGKPVYVVMLGGLAPHFLHIDEPENYDG